MNPDDETPGTGDLLRESGREHRVPGYEHAAWMRDTERAMLARWRAGWRPSADNAVTPPDDPPDVAQAPLSTPAPVLRAPTRPPPMLPRVASPDGGVKPPDDPPDVAQAPLPATAPPAPDGGLFSRPARTSGAFAVPTVTGRVPVTAPPAPKSPPSPKPRAARIERGAIVEPTVEDIAALRMPIHTLEAWTDGSGTRRPLQAGIGVCVLANGVVVAEAAWSIGEGSNNDAELRAILCALGIAQKIAPRAALTIYSDSEWAIGAANPDVNWRLRDEAQEEWANVARARVRLRVDRGGGVAFVHVNGHQRPERLEGKARRLAQWNERVDRLAGEARRRGINRHNQGTSSSSGGNDGGA